MALNRLWNQKLDPLFVRFREEPTSAVDEVIEFLETDVPAFRCGYVKEFYLQHLKAVRLTKGQEDRLRKAALKLCELDNVRREFRRWANLMTPLANRAFVDDLREILANQEKRRAANLMLDTILKHRRELV